MKRRSRIAAIAIAADTVLLLPIVTNLVTNTVPSWLDPYVEWSWILAAALAVGPVWVIYRVYRPPVAARDDLRGRESPAGRPWMIDHAATSATVDRPELMDTVLSALLSEPGRMVGVTTALAGAGGFGKTTLARQVGFRDEVRGHFGGGLLWVTVGEHSSGPDLAGKIGFLCEQLGAESSEESDPDRAGWRLGRLLDQRAATLLIVDDVWTAAQLAPFLHAGASCTRLVTTRMPRLVPTGSVSVFVDEMSPVQSLELLSSGLGVSPRVVEPLIAVTGRWPLLMALVHAAVADRVQAGADPDAAVAEHVRLLEAEGPQIGDDLGKEWYRERLVTATVTASLDRLEAVERERYRELGIFPEDVVVPRDVVGLLWGATAGFSAEQTARLRGRLQSLSLLSPSSGDGMRLHDVLRDYLQHDLGAQQLSMIHGQFVDAAARLLPTGSSGASEWWRLSAEQTYLWDMVAYHLRCADRAGELAAMVEDLRWICQRVARSGAVAAESDLVGVNTPAAVALRGVLARSAHLLGRMAQTEDLTSTLLACLAGVPELVVHAERLRETANGWVLDHRWQTGGGQTSELRRTLVGHTDAIRAVGVAPDGSWLVTGSRDETARIWDTATGTTRATLAGHGGGGVWAVAIAPDGSWLATGGGDGIVRIWDSINGKLLWSWQARGSGWRVWVETRLGRWREYSLAVKALVIAPDGSWLAATGDRATVGIINLATKTIRETLYGHTSEVTAMAVAPNGSWIVTGSSDLTARLWGTAKRKTLVSLLRRRTGTLIRNPIGTQQDTSEVLGWVEAVAVAPNGGWLAIGNRDAVVQLWDLTARTVRAAIVHSARQRSTLRGHSSWVTAVAIGPDGAWLVTGSSDGTARVWDALNGKALATFTGHAEWITAVAIAPSGSWLVTGSTDGTARIWNPDIDEADLPLTNSAAGWVAAVAIPPDDSWIATGGNDGVVRIWDPSNGASARTFLGHAPITSIVAPNSSWLAVGSQDTTAKILVLGSKNEYRTEFRGHTADVTAVAVSPSGSWLATASRDQTVRIWDLNTGKRHPSSTLATLALLCGHNSDVIAMTIAPGGAWIATGSTDMTVRLWDLTGRKTRSASHNYSCSVTALAIAPDGSCIAIGGSDGSIQIWNTVTRTVATTLSGHSSLIATAAFAPDGSWLATGSSDRTLRVWNTTTFDLAVIIRTRGPVTSCAWAASGKWLAVGGTFGVAVLELHRAEAEDRRA